MKKTSNETKSRIVSAAWKLFYQYGYNNTTIDDIAELSQTSKGTFYHYFNS
ncbi:MAG: TetR/AcrR family transcriptional regulator, partial [Eubacteriales bacterium]|nr:TetR/AcrR family transcriptional regulator [Eubacteriales bacterium]